MVSHLARRYSQTILNPNNWVYANKTYSNILHDYKYCTEMISLTFPTFIVASSRPYNVATCIHSTSSDRIPKPDQVLLDITEYYSSCIISLYIEIH